jgi:hypothetical protein
MADVDTMRITEEHPDPANEYSREAAEIAQRIIRTEEEGRKINGEVVESILREIFRREFEVDLASDDASGMANSIVTLLTVTLEGKQSD